MDNDIKSNETFYKIVYRLLPVCLTDCLYLWYRNHKQMRSKILDIGCTFTPLHLPFQEEKIFRAGDALVLLVPQLNRQTIPFRKYLTGDKGFTR